MSESWLNTGCPSDQCSIFQLWTQDIPMTECATAVSTPREGNQGLWKNVTLEKLLPNVVLVETCISNSQRWMDVENEVVAVALQICSLVENVAELVTARVDCPVLPFGARRHNETQAEDMYSRHLSVYGSFVYPVTQGSKQTACPSSETFWYNVQSSSVIYQTSGMLDWRRRRAEPGTCETRNSKGQRKSLTRGSHYCPGRDRARYKRREQESRVFVTLPLKSPTLAPDRHCLQWSNGGFVNEVKVLGTSLKKNLCTGVDRSGEVPLRKFLIHGWDLKPLTWMTWKANLIPFYQRAGGEAKLQVRLEKSKQVLGITAFVGCMYWFLL